MGSSSRALGPESQQLNRVVSIVSSASGTGSFSFPSPPQGFSWIGTLSCATANTGTVFTATIGATSWGQWGGNSVFGPVQARSQSQLVVTATGLTANTTYVMTWIGSSDLDDNVQAVWPDSNSTALTAQISGTVPISGTVTTAAGSVSTVSGTVTTGAGSVSTVTGVVASSTASTTINATGLSGASTTLTVASTTNFTTSGFLTVLGSGGALVFAYTGTTSTTFTGCTLALGTSSWTIANGTAVVQNTAFATSSTVSGTVTTGAASQTNAAGLDSIVASYGFTSLPATSSNYTCAQSYTGFIVGFQSSGLSPTSIYISNVTQGFTYVINRPGSGQGSTPTGYFINSSGFNYLIPLQANAGDSVQIIVNGSGSSVIGGTVQLVGMKSSGVLAVTPSPNQSFDVVNFGGTSAPNVSVTATSNASILAAPSAGYAYRLHSFAGPYNAAVSVGGSLRDAAGNVYASISPQFPFANMGGSICKAQLFANNFGAATQAFSLIYDTIVIPNVI